MKDADLYVISGMSSSSPAMFERRRRILQEARRLIGRGHPESFSVRDLCDRAGVAPNTLYNAFGSKENVMALAITQYFEEFYQVVEFEHPPEGFAGVIERELATTVRDLAIPNYVTAVTALYFSSSDRALRTALVAIAGRAYLPWLRELQMKRQLEAGVALDRVVCNLSHLLYALVRDWRVGVLTDETFITARLDASLCYLAGVLRGAARKAVRELFADLHGDRHRVNALIQTATQQVSLKKLRAKK